MEGKMLVCDTPEKIRFFQLISLRGRLKLEIKGMKFRGPSSTATAVKKMFGLSVRCRNATALARLEEEIRNMKRANSAWRN